jgi:uncharacterized protein (TIGR02284 family)
VPPPVAVPAKTVGTVLDVANAPGSAHPRHLLIAPGQGRPERCAVVDQLQLYGAKPIGPQPGGWRAASIAGRAAVETEVIANLKTLHTRAIDACHGYGEAVRQADGKGLTPLFSRMVTLHTRNGDELAIALQGLGEQANDDGSFMSTVHRTIMDIRSLFGGLDESVLPGLIDGETRNVDAYDDVLKMLDVPEHLRELLDQQRARLASAIADMQAMKR